MINAEIIFPNTYLFEVEILPVIDDKEQAVAFLKFKCESGHVSLKFTDNHQIDCLINSLLNFRKQQLNGVAKKYNLEHEDG
jgi:hypothetical protein